MTAALVDRLRALPAADRARILGDLSWREKAMLKYIWAFWARPDEREEGKPWLGTGQLPPPGDWIWWVNQGGRGSGKSTACIHAFATDAYELGRDFVGVILVENDEEGRKLIEDPKSGMRAILPPHQRPTFEPSIEGGKLTFPSGAIAHLVSAEKPSKGRAANFNRWYIDDPPKFGPQAMGVFLALKRAFRLQGHGLRCYIATTPPGNPPPRCPELLEHLLEAQFRPDLAGDWVYSITASDDNFSNLDADVRRVLLGTESEEADEAERGGVYNKEGGARVFSGIDFSRDPVRVLSVPDVFDVGVISIDPADSANKKACEVGIGFLGLVRSMSSAFVCEDASDRYDSDQWPKVAWDLAERWIPRCREWRFVIEVNRGTKDSTLLRNEDTIRQLRRNPGALALSSCEIQPVTSREDKGARAAPLPAAYRAGHVKHLAGLDEAEKQMRRLTSVGTGGRLDRADMVVQGLLSLFGWLNGQTSTPLGVSSVQAGSFGRAPMSAINVGATQAPQAQPTQAAAFTFAMPGGVGRGTFT